MVDGKKRRHEEDSLEKDDPDWCADATDDYRFEYFNTMYFITRLCSHFSDDSDTDASRPTWTAVNWYLCFVFSSFFSFLVVYVYCNGTIFTVKIC